MAFLRYQHVKIQLLASVGAVALSIASASVAVADTGLTVPVNRSSLVVLPSAVKEIIIADPDIADVHAHNSTTLTVIGKKAGGTNVRVFDDAGKLVRTFDVVVGYDLPAIRKALKTFIPDESIGVEMVNSSVALIGQVRDAGVADRAVKITQDFIVGKADEAGAPAAAEGNDNPKILNLLKISSGQQVMLRVRVGEVNRDAIKRLGIDPSVDVLGTHLFGNLALGSTIKGLAKDATADYELPDSSYRGVFTPGWVNGNDRAYAVIKAMERDGLFKTLAEPNLVAISGESAEFLAGGEVPIPVAQSNSSGSSGSNVTVEYKPYGVSVKFTPDVLSESRIRIKVQPEVSDVTFTNGVSVSGLPVPSIATRRAKTTVELAPGESFMIAGLMKDKTSATIEQLPGLKNLPVLGALFRSTDFQRNESELVIAVTPFIVDPLKSADVKLPTDDFRPASQMEMFFYGALGAINSEGHSVTEMPALEGPTGFMVD